MTLEEQNIESDSIVASCNCVTKSPDIQFHKKGCKYRLIVERDSLTAELASAKAELEEAKSLLILATPYMRHDDWCDSNQIRQRECNCSFARVRAALARGEGKEAKT
jgi:hypothetical protein